MVCAQVMGHDLAIGIAACQGQLELNTYKPLIALNALDSARLLSDAIDSFARHCVAGLRANLPHMAHMLEQSLCDVMALVPHLGHDEAARIARHAQTEGVSLKQAAWALADVDGTLFDTWLRATRLDDAATKGVQAAAQSANDSRPADLESLPGFRSAR
jgi:fumarate hydratase class II